MRRNNFALRLQPSLMEEARKVAESEGVALNQLINVALAEKLSALRTEEYFQERIRRADRAETLRILDRSGKGNAPMDLDELTPDLAPDGKRAGEKSKPGEEQLPNLANSKSGKKKHEAAEFGLVHQVLTGFEFPGAAPPRRSSVGNFAPVSRVE